MKLHGKNLVAGNLGSASDKTFQAVNPATGEKLDGTFHCATKSDVDIAMRESQNAFLEYRMLSGARKADFLEHIAEEILGLGDALLNRCHLETGLPIDRLAGERARTVNQLRMFANLVREGSWVDARIDLAEPDRKPQPKPDLRRLLVPLGPVVVFASSNFPLAFSVAGGDTASALAAGCPVAFKAHKAHPGTSEMVATAVGRAVAACSDVPAGVFSLLHGDGAVVGMEMVRHPHASAVGFTGSLTAGRALFDAASSRSSPIPVFAEMSSLNPVFLFPEALRARGRQIAEGLFQSFTLGVGQFCTKPGLVFAVKGAELAEFATHLSSLVEGAVPGTMLNERIHTGFCQGVAAAEKLTDIVARAPLSSDATKKGAPTVFRVGSRTFLETDQLSEEVFGPFTLLVECETTKDFEPIAERLAGQLTATVHAQATEPIGGLLDVVQRKAGRLLYNTFPTGVEVCPAMHHGGPYPATTDARFTSVGTAAIQRFARPVCYQNWPAHLLPEELRNENPSNLWRTVNGRHSQDDV